MPLVFVPLYRRYEYRCLDGRGLGDLPDAVGPGILSLTSLVKTRRVGLGWLARVPSSSRINARLKTWKGLGEVCVCGDKSEKIAKCSVWIRRASETVSVFVPGANWLALTGVFMLVRALTSRCRHLRDEASLSIGPGPRSLFVSSVCLLPYLVIRVHVQQDPSL